MVDSMRKWPNLERTPLQTNTQQTLITYKSKHKQINKLAENITGMTDSYFVSSQLLRSQLGTHSDPSHIRRFLRMILVMIIIMTKMTKVLILSASFASIYRRTLHRHRQCVNVSTIVIWETISGLSDPSPIISNHQHIVFSIVFHASRCSIDFAE